MNAPTPAYDDEIDLRAVFQTLWKARLPILILTLVAAAAAYAVSAWLLPREYQASAYVAIGRPSIQYYSSEILSIVPTVPDIKALPELLKTSAILEQVTGDSRVAALLPANVKQLPGQISVTTVGASQLRLDVTGTDPRLTAAAAAVWAEKAVDWIELNYGIGAFADTIDGNIAQFQQAYEKAQAEMETFLAQDQTPILSSKLSARNDIYGCLEKKISAANSLLARLAQFDSNLAATDEALSSSDALLLASIEQEIGALGVCGGQMTVLQSLSPARFSGVSSAEGKRVIGDIRNNLDRQVKDAQAQQQVLQEEIQDLSAKIDRLNYQRGEYDRQRAQAASVYQQLTLQKSVVDNILRQSGGVAAVSADAVKAKPVSMSPFVIAAMAGLTMAFAASAWVLFRERLADSSQEKK